MSKRVKIARVIIFVLFLLALLYLTVHFWDDIASLKDAEVRDAFISDIRNKGFSGWFSLLMIQLLQVLIAFLPGEIVEVVSGVLYGTIGGLFTCLLGIIIGSSLVYVLAKYIGKPFINLFVSDEKFNKYRFINNEKKISIILLIIFAIPGTPKDVLTYFAPLLKIKWWKFILISTFARIPTIISSTIVGQSIDSNQWEMIFIVYGTTIVLSLIGALIGRWFIKKHSKQVIVFDLDGTLLNTLEDLQDSLNYVLTKYNLPVRTLEETRKFVGNGIVKLLERATDNKLPNEDISKMYDDFMTYYLQHLDIKTKPYEGIIDSLTTLKKQGYSLAIASNKTISAVEKLSDKYFNNLIDLSVGVSSTTRPKPSGDMIDLITKHFNCYKEDIIYFGDSKTDIETCRLNNLKCTCVSWGFEPLETLLSYPNLLIIDHPDEIIKVIKNKK